MRVKTKEAKQVNRCVKKLNRQLRNDVFGDRFEARQIQKSFGDGIEYFMYMLVDHEQPERNEIVPWESAFAICNFSHIHIAMNKFIVESDFWKKYYEKNPR